MGSSSRAGLDGRLYSRLQPLSCANSIQERSASAEMVSSGLTPRERDMTAPSDTYSPSCTAVPPFPEKTWPLWFTTPLPASSPMQQPPRGWTVTRLWLVSLLHVGFLTKVPPSGRVASSRVSETSWKICLAPTPGQSMRTLSSSRTRVPLLSSWVFTR